MQALPGCPTRVQRLEEGVRPESWGKLYVRCLWGRRRGGGKGIGTAGRREKGEGGQGGGRPFLNGPLAAGSRGLQSAWSSSAALYQQAQDTSPGKNNNGNKSRKKWCWQARPGLCTGRRGCEGLQSASEYGSQSKPTARGAGCLRPKFCLGVKAGRRRKKGGRGRGCARRAGGGMRCLGVAAGMEQEVGAARMAGQRWRQC